jgi:hypothetical protein
MDSIIAVLQKVGDARKPRAKPCPCDEASLIVTKSAFGVARR